MSPNYSQEFAWRAQVWQPISLAGEEEKEREKEKMTTTYGGRSSV